MTKIRWQIKKSFTNELDLLDADILPGGDTEIICPKCGLEAHIHNTPRNIFVSCCYCDLSGIGGKIIEP